MIFEFEHSEALIEAALEEFAAKGYEQASINAILKAAGMSKGQFYYHFESKEALYMALIEMLIARKREFMTPMMQDLQGDIFSIFEAQIRYGLAFAREHPAINRFGARFAQEQGSPIYEKALEKYNFAGNEAINQLIDAGLANGDFRDDLPPAFIRRAVSYLFTHAADLADLTCADTTEANMGYLVEFMRAGLGRR